MFRYLDVFDAIGGFGLSDGLPKAQRWRQALGSRPSVAEAARADYTAMLRGFLLARRSALSRRMALDGASA